MATTINRPPHYVILGARGRRWKQLLPGVVSFCDTPAGIEKIYDSAHGDLTWITYSPYRTEDLLKAAARRETKRGRVEAPWRELVLTLTPPRPGIIPALHRLFPKTVGSSTGYQLLPKEELLQVFLSDSGLDLSSVVIAVAADRLTQTITLLRGNLQELTLPFSFFDQSGDGIKPDFGKARVTDFGRTLALGNYEASVDAILYEADSRYRAKVNKQRKENEKSFGASLQRLRLQRKVKRSEFPGISSKTIARIERNEVEKPHGATLEVIAHRLGVLPGEIGEY